MIVAGPEQIGSAPTTRQARSAVRQSLQRTFAALLAGHAVRALYQLVSVPLLIRSLGETGYAGWLLLLTIPSYLTLADCGICSIAANEMAIAAAQEKRDRCVELYQALWAALIVVAGVVSLATGLALFGLDHPHIAGLEKLGRTGFQSAVWLLVVSTLAAQATGAALAGLRSAGRFAVGLQITNAGRLLEIGLLVGMLFATNALNPLIGVTVAARLLTFAATMAYLGKVAPWLPMRPRFSAVGEMGRLLPAGLLFLAIPFGNAMLMQGMIWVLAAVSGAVAVVQVTLARTLANLARQGISLAGNSFWPEISTAFGGGDREKLRWLCATGFRLSVAASFGTAAVLLVFGPFVLQLWARPVEISPWFFRMIVIAMLADAFWIFPLAIVAAVNQHGSVAIAYLTVTTLSLILVAAGLPKMGVDVVPIALFLVGIFMTVFTLRVADRIVGVRLVELLFRANR